jgi:hypothetical protein
MYKLRNSLAYPLRYIVIQLGQRAGRAKILPDTGFDPGFDAQSDRGFVSTHIL